MIQPADGTSSLLAGAILAGGRSRRMGGIPKALCRLAGKPLLQHVIDRIGPQVSSVYLSVEQFSEPLATFGLPQLPDPGPDAGPLAGLLSALQKMDPVYEWLFLVPCDAPFLPRNLARKLLDNARSSGLPGSVVRYDSELQPTFSIWNRSLCKPLERAVSCEGMTGLKQFLRVTDLAVLDWPVSEPSPFFNINDQGALLQACRLVESSGRKASKCSA